LLFANFGENKFFDIRIDTAKRMSITLDLEARR
jgi:hypothetical protein